MIRMVFLNGVANIELTNIQKKNAFSVHAYQQLAEALRKAQEEEEVRSILLYGQADFFSIGNDLEEFTKIDFTDPASELRQFMHTLSHCEKPVIAAVNGPALGIGATLLLHCDLVYAADTSSFAFPFVNLGLVPDFATTYILPRLMGQAMSSEKLLLGLPFSAQEALDMGLVNSVLPQPELLNYARLIAERFKGLPPQAVRATKKLLRRSFLQEVDVAIEAEMTVQAECIKGEEVKEVMTAFFEKRKPQFYSSN